MKPIIIPASKLSNRCNKVSKMLRPLRKQNVGCSINTAIRTRQIVAAHDAGNKKISGQSLFHTKAKGIWGEYYEYWRPNENRLVLNRAYFHLYKWESHCDLKLLVCIHCDPEGNQEHQYKLGPHLHVKASEPPIPQSHFPLNQCHLDDVLKNITSLTNAFSTAIQIIADEVLARLEN